MMHWLNEELVRAKLRSTLLHFDEYETEMIQRDVLARVFDTLDNELGGDKFDTLLARLGLSIDEAGMVNYNDFIDSLVTFSDNKQRRSDGFKPEKRKENAQAMMKQAGIHPEFLTDQHWHAIWDKHFERFRRKVDLGNQYHKHLLETYSNDNNLRVLQWNLLAEGLVPEGFLSPLVSKEHHNGTDTHLQKVAEKDLALAAQTWQKGCRNIVWQEPEEGGSGEYVEFAKMAHEMIYKMKGLEPDEKKKIGQSLKERYNSDIDHTGQQLTVNELAVTAAEHRLERVFWFIEISRPDVIVLEELDNFGYVREELGKVGYHSSADEGVKYVRLADRVATNTGVSSGEQYLDRLRQSPYAFAPKLNSNAAKFLGKRKTPKKASLGGRDWPIDDDGTAIFWRSDRLRIIGVPEFILLPGSSDMKKFLGGETSACEVADSDQACVRVRLEFIDHQAPHCGHQFYVMGTHLSSGAGDQKEKLRVLELQKVWSASNFPEIWSMDANTELDEEEVEIEGIGKTNALRSFMRDRQLESVWQEFYKETGTEGREEYPPVSVWKMRGSASAQPAKVGEDQFHLIDHICYSGKQLFTKGKQALRLRERKWPELDKRDWLALMPNEVVPSDHLPIVWDFHLRQTPRFPAIVLMEAAQATTNEIFDLLPDECDGKKELVESHARLFHLSGCGEQSWIEDVDKFWAVMRGLLKDVDGEASLSLAVFDVVGSIMYLAAAEHHKPATEGEATDKRRFLALRSLRSVMQAMNFYANNVVDCGSLQSRCTTIWRLAAQAAEAAVGVPDNDFNATLIGKVGSREAEKVAITDVMDRGGAFEDAEEVDQIIAEAYKLISSKVDYNIVPALLALGCVRWKDTRATGSQAKAVVELVLEVLVDPGTIVRTRSTDSSHTGLIQQVCHFVMRRISASPNFDTGGALQYLLEQVHRVGKEETTDYEIASRVRDAMCIAFGKLSPEKLLVKVQRIDLTLDLEGAAKVATGHSAADELVFALKPFEDRDRSSEMRSMGYLLKTIARLLKRNKANPLLGPKLFVAPMLLNDGVKRLENIVRLNVDLEDTDMNKWRTSSRAAEVLMLLLENSEDKDDPLLAMFQARLQDQLMETDLAKLLCRVPNMINIEKANRTADVSFHVENLHRHVERLRKHLLKLGAMVKTFSESTTASTDG